MTSHSPATNTGSQPSQGELPDPSPTHKAPVAETEALRAVRELLNQDVNKLRKYRVDPARGLLLSGPPGVGKTHAVGQAAKERGLKMWMIVPGPQALGRLQDAVKKHAKRECVIFIDEMDQAVGMDVGMVGTVKQLFDDDTCNAYIIGATNSAGALHPSLLSAGRMDRHVHLGALDEWQRFHVLRAICDENAERDDLLLRKVAALTPGYVVGDLKSLVSRVKDCLGYEVENQDTTPDDVLRVWKAEIRNGPTPAVLRTSLTVSVSGEGGWDMVFGNAEAKQELQRAIEWPLKHKETFERLDLRRPRGILLHGPPGCAKTTLVRAAAARISIPLLRLTAADVYSSYVGDSERILRDAFTKARAAAPALLFLDEIDALAMRREHEQSNDDGGSKVQQRVLTTLLTEMDGLATSSAHYDDGVIVVAATNRVDVLDDAILRPGRFDKVIHVDLPSLEERVEMLKLFTRKLNISDCVDFEYIASRTAGKSGAHLKGICEQAALAALRERVLQDNWSEDDISSEQEDPSDNQMIVCMRHFDIK